MSRTGKNIDVWCPLCAPSDRSKKKLSIRLDDDANHCWTCDWKARSLVALIKRFGTREQLTDYRDRFMPADKRQSLRCVWIDDASKPDPLVLPKDFRLLVHASTSDPDVKAALRYVESRGIKERDLWHYKLGVSDDSRWRRRIIVPSFDADGKLNYFVGRAIDKQRKPKYDNPDNDKLSIIFNEMNVDWTQRLVLCEGAFDMTKCGDNAVPLLGSSLNEQSLLFNQIIVHNTPIALALDADMLETRVPSIASKLAEYDITVSIVDVRPFSDPGSMSKKQFQEKLQASHVYSWHDTFNSKLSRATRTLLTL